MASGAWHLAPALASALEWMDLKNVPGFTDEVVDTFLRKVAKVQGDLTLIEETRLKPQ